MWGVDRLSFHLSCLLRPSAPVLPCLGFLTGAGGLSNSVLVVWALHGSPSRPQWESCPFVCVWCLGGTEGGVMFQWCVG